MGAFKIRGAFNMIAQLPKDALERGVITYSSGNHGQAVALAAKTLGAPAVIVMPTTAPAVKVDGCKGYGAEVIMEGTTSLHRQARAEKEAAARGLTIVPPFDHKQIIIGQGTTGLEILEQCPEVGHRVRAGRRRRARVGRRRGDQAVEAVGARDRGRARRARRRCRSRSPPAIRSRSTLRRASPTG